jgi:hypothetical protein
MATQFAFGKIVTNGLVLALDAADKNSYPGSGTTWRDLSGNGLNGTLTNGPTFNSANGGSIVFDGVDDYTNISYNSNLNASTWTLSVWFKLNPGYEELDTIVTRTYYSPELTINYYIDCGLIAQNKFRIGSYKFSPVADQNITSSTTVTSTIGKWTNIVGYRTSDFKVGVFVNGVFETESTFSSVDFSSTNINSGMTIGALSLSGVLGRFTNGTVANTQLYNRALSASEILQNYNAQKSRFNL